MRSMRAGRVADQIKREIADILTKKARDPRIGFVTVTGVKVSDDLHHAKIYVSVHERQDVKKTFAGLKKAGGFVRGELARRLPLRRVPDLVFSPDNASEGLSQILNVLDQIEHEDDLVLFQNKENRTKKG